MLNAGVAGLRFYLPNFEDLVDPDYDFVQDRPSPKHHDRFEHDWYPHQFFAEPIFDGVLMSKTVVSPAVETRILEGGGVHAFMRLDKCFPVMGDCGAFTYRDEWEPPYNTDQVLDYYQSLGFSYGVSIDHLIFSAFSAQEQSRRWNLTLRNAEEFLRRHREKQCTFSPVGIAQGPSPERYAAAVLELVKMGYTHLALGGLARSNDKAIRAVLEAVALELPRSVELHLFGVARLSLVPDLMRFGVTSVDSASPMRRAFLGTSEDNYWTASGRRYAAIRVPEAITRRRKRGVDHPEDIINGEQPIDSVEHLVELEQRALEHLRAYERGDAGLRETLGAILVYDRLFGQERNHEGWYRRVLEDCPWRSCDCAICQQAGIEVMIFRGNNRNRRRGFHNTRVFYHQFREAVAACSRHDSSSQEQRQPQQLSLDLLGGSDASDSTGKRAPQGDSPAEGRGCRT